MKPSASLKKLIKASAALSLCLALPATVLAADDVKPLVDESLVMAKGGTVHRVRIPADASAASLIRLTSRRASGKAMATTSFLSVEVGENAGKVVTLILIPMEPRGGETHLMARIILADGSSVAGKYTLFQTPSTYHSVSPRKIYKPGDTLLDFGYNRSQSTLISLTITEPKK
ncbi:hypothetical protein SAMN02745181_0349 [Rubritalea squalenifaciens DSM 18772]|uniref:Uncharacterized protein n=1 Tax=Rubritalea squalenifaciens DSM 18772 TaxID=1123071 RepID=A0A1M6BZC2_9BACT|nr:hypothetical protein [Rubritalea squalenifaciens]SHI54155.1 hypothetical protein SAMN02745181_0349 [Rubritalea squalenifaciens DSM 18772]